MDQWETRVRGKNLFLLYNNPNGPEAQFSELQKTIDETDNLIPNSIQLNTTLQGWVSFYFFIATFLIPASEGLPSLKK